MGEAVEKAVAHFECVARDNCWYVWAALKMTYVFYLVCYGKPL